MSVKANTAWVPDCGDIVWLEFDPQAGRERAGHRPAVVLSPASYNAKAGMMLCCPTTTKIKGYPFEVALTGKTTSVVLSDQVRSLDWRARKAKFCQKSLRLFGSGSDCWSDKENKFSNKFQTIKEKQEITCSDWLSLKRASSAQWLPIEQQARRNASPVDPPFSLLS